MAEPIEVSEDVCVPAKAIQVKAVRSGGPGGQNVNKVASKVELRIDLERIEGLDDGALTASAIWPIFFCSRRAKVLLKQCDAALNLSFLTTRAH